ncbi:MAG: glycine cleavage system protein H [Deltaproteobacteria bacterium]|nr:glycine cleavage system protein H [Deltaproteobacteria bacterium]
MSEFLETTYDKFVFKAKVGCLYTRDDFWAQVEGAVAIVGVADFLQKVKGDVAFIETVESGLMVKQGDELGKVETIKATFSIISPVTGKIIEVNPDMDPSPHFINQDPYGAGWVYKIELTNLEKDRKALLDAQAYFELMKEKINEEMNKKG